MSVHIDYGSPAHAHLCQLQTAEGFLLFEQIAEGRTDTDEGRDGGESFDNAAIYKNVGWAKRCVRTVLGNYNHYGIRGYGAYRVSQMKSGAGGK